MALSLYDRHIPFFDGTVEVRDVDLQVLAVGEANSLRDGGRRHHRMLIDREFDACEVSLSSYIMAKSQGFPLIAIPVFPRRLFVQSNIWVHDESAIREPMELVGAKVGLITFQTTLSVQAKGDLQTEYGVPWREIDWYVAADEPIAFADPGTVVLKRIPRDKKLGEMLASKSLDAIITPRPPGPTSNTKSKFRRLFQTRNKPNLHRLPTTFYKRPTFVGRNRFSRSRSPNSMIGLNDTWLRPLRKNEPQKQRVWN